jgi:hypothetical protein
VPNLCSTFQIASKIKLTKIVKFSHQKFKNFYENFYCGKMKFLGVLTSNMTLAISLILTTFLMLSCWTFDELLSSRLHKFGLETFFKLTFLKTTFNNSQKYLKHSIDLAKSPTQKLTKHQRAVIQSANVHKFLAPFQVPKQQKKTHFNFTNVINFPIQFLYSAKQNRITKPCAKLRLLNLIFISQQGVTFWKALCQYPLNQFQRSLVSFQLLHFLSRIAHLI